MSIWIVKRYYNGQLDDISPYYFKTYEYASEYEEMVRDKEDTSYSYSIVQIEKEDRWKDKDYEDSPKGFVAFLLKK